MFKKAQILFFLIALTGLSVLAQSELDTISVEIVTEYKPTISDAHKINDNPSIYDTVPLDPKLSYFIKSTDIKSPFQITPVHPARIKGEPLTKLYRCYTRLGIGSYKTPYAELFCNNLRSKDYAYGVHLKHLSSEGKIKNTGYSGYSDNYAGLYGKKFFKNNTLSATLDYNRDAVHFYGFDANEPLIKVLDDTITGKNAIRQRYSIIEGKINLESGNNDSSMTDYNIRMQYYNLDQFTGATENNLLSAARLGHYLNKEYLQLDASVDYYLNKFPALSASDIATSEETALISLSPSVLASGKKYKFAIGINTYFGLGVESAFYPSVNFSYDFMDGLLVAYSGISGKVIRNSMKLLAAENPFIVTKPDLQITNNPIHFYLGLKGSVSKNASFNIHVIHDKMENMPMFVNDTSLLLKNKFTLVYDNIEIFNVGAEFSLHHSEKFKTMLTGDFYNYTTDFEMATWHKPSYKVALSATYNMSNKIFFNADIFMIGKQYAKTYQMINGNPELEKTKLKGIADINMGIEYRYSSRLSAFLNLNNIGSVKYYRWNQYPSQRFNILGGFAYGF